MEWGKGKSILIWIFLILNVALAVSVVNLYFNRRVGYESRAEIEQIIDKRGIILECKLPFEVFETKRLVYEDNRACVADMAAIFAEAAGADAGAAGAVEAEAGAADAEAAAEVAEAVGVGTEVEATGASAAGAAAAAETSDPTIGAGTEAVVLLNAESFIYTNSAPNEKFETEDEKKLAAAVISMLDQYGIDVTGYVTDEILPDGSGGKIIKYIQKYEGQFIFDSYLQVFVNTDGGVYKVAASCRGVKGFSEETKMRMIPVYQLILRYFFQSGLVIKSIDIGYLGHDSIQNVDLFLQNETFTESVEGAVWRLKMGDGSERYFDGAYGDEIFIMNI